MEKKKPYNNTILMVKEKELNALEIIEIKWQLKRRNKTQKDYRKKVPVIKHIQTSKKSIESFILNTGS